MDDASIAHSSISETASQKPLAVTPSPCSFEKTSALALGLLEMTTRLFHIHKSGSNPIDRSSPAVSQTYNPLTILSS
jgi:hypothetical protein